MQVTPNSDIYLFRNVPLNITYEHTIFFPSQAAQESYFAGLRTSGLTFNKQSYQRVSKGVIRVNARYTNVYGVNYMQFKNAGSRDVGGIPFNPYLDKYFYAFVLNAEYINEEVVELTYTLDVMQTWFFDAVLKPCYIDREHASTDNIGDNLLPEPVNAGEYRYSEVAVSNDTSSNWFKFYKNLMIYVLTSADLNSQTGEAEPIQGQMINGVYSGLKIKVFDTNSTGINNLNTWLLAMADALVSDRIVAIYTAPSAFGSGTTTPTTTSLEVNRPHMQTVQGVTSVANGWTFTETISTPSGNITVTRPHNNKLYTSPFTFLHCSAPNGSDHDFQYEYFTSTEALFQLSGVASGQPEMQLVPQYYKGVTNNLNERIVYNGYPMNSWAVDAYRAWLAQNQGRMNITGVRSALNLAGNIAGAVVGVYRSGSANIDYQAENAQYAEGAALLRMQKANPANVIAQGTPAGKAQAIVQGLSAAADFGTEVAYMMNENKIASSRGSEAKGSATSDIDMACGTNYIHMYDTRVTNYYASLIDDYFDRYGYATKRIKVPNRNVRKYWTYTKTIGCQVDATGSTGGIPENDRRAIEYIYDKGITFWRATVTGSGSQIAVSVDVGNYQHADGNPIQPA